MAEVVLGPVPPLDLLLVLEKRVGDEIVVEVAGVLRVVLRSPVGVVLDLDCRESDVVSPCHVDPDIDVVVDWRCVDGARPLGQCVEVDLYPSLLVGEDVARVAARLGSDVDFAVGRLVRTRRGSRVERPLAEARAPGADLLVIRGVAYVESVGDCVLRVRLVRAGRKVLDLSVERVVHAPEIEIGQVGVVHGRSVASRLRLYGVRDFDLAGPRPLAPFQSGLHVVGVAVLRRSPLVVR